MDDYGGEAYLPMVSDWDLSAAFLSASDPDLQLIVETKNVPLDVEDGPGDYEEEQWDVISTADKAPHDTGPLLTDSQDEKYSQKTECNTSGFSSQSSLSMMSRVSSAVSQTNQQYPISFNAKINTAGLFNAVRNIRKCAL